MILNDIKLKNFRNYADLDLSFSKGINILYGKNAQGKTNLLESIYVLSLTKSHRSFIDHHLIKEGQGISKICGNIKKNGLLTTYELLLDRNKKKCFIDKDEIKKLSDYIANLHIIIFYPEDLEIIKGSPQLRRRYINMEISQLEGNYFKALNDYTRLLKMRNEALKQMTSIQDMDHPYFLSITEYFLEKASFLYKMRVQFIEKINEYCQTIFFDISSIHNFHIKYESPIIVHDITIPNIKEQYKQKLLDMKYREYRSKMTMVGPHKDDISFWIGEINLKNFGSQGQQRIAILSLKLAEIKVFSKYNRDEPILLLDDVFSELDDIKKNNLLSYIDGKIQTIITTTEITHISDSILRQAKLIEIEDGAIKSINEVN